MSAGFKSIYPFNKLVRPCGSVLLKSFKNLFDLHEKKWENLNFFF